MHRFDPALIAKHPSNGKGHKNGFEAKPDAQKAQDRTQQLEQTIAALETELQATRLQLKAELQAKLDLGVRLTFLQGCNEQLYMEKEQIKTDLINLKNAVPLSQATVLLKASTWGRLAQLSSTKETVLAKHHFLREQRAAQAKVAAEAKESKPKNPPPPGLTLPLPRLAPNKA